MKKEDKVYLLLFLFAFVLFLSVLWLVFSVPTIEYSGFALDSAGNIYLGKDGGTIQVVDPSGAELRRFSATTSRGYNFTIKDDQVLVSHWPYIVTLDLYGNEITREDLTDIDYSLFPKYSKYKFTDADGTLYRIKLLQFRTKIYRCTENGEVCIFKMPLRDLLKKSMFIGCVPLINVLVFVGLLLVYRPKKPKTTGNASVF